MSQVQDADSVATAPPVAAARIGVPIRLGRPSLVPVLPIFLIVLVTFLSIFAPLFTSYGPNAQDLRNALQPPFFINGGDWAHPLGTDSFGRDIWTRILYGGRVSLSIAALSLVLGATIAVLVGISAGYFGGGLDSALMRVTDMFLALPTLIVALAIAIALGPSYINLILIVGLMIWPRTARLVRADTLLIKRQDYARYARAIGVPTWILVFRHVLPNVMPTILVMVTLEVGAVILLEASLSFLGAGIPPPNPSWGTIIADGRGLIASGWWIALFPGIVISIMVMSTNVLGDWLRDRLDPMFREA